jgi:hypothetical protein
MEKQIHLGDALLRVLVLIVVKPFVLPLRIYKNALIDLSNADADDSDESNLSADFPIYVWVVSIFNALICLAYPIIFIKALIALISGDGFWISLGILAGGYFTPLILGLIREFSQITLKTLLYLKIISKK